MQPDRSCGDASGYLCRSCRDYETVIEIAAVIDHALEANSLISKRIEDILSVANEADAGGWTPLDIAIAHAAERALYAAIESLYAYAVAFHPDKVPPAGPSEPAGNAPEADRHFDRIWDFMMANSDDGTTDGTTPDGTTPPSPQTPLPDAFRYLDEAPND